MDRVVAVDLYKGTAYTILLELERILKAAKSDITIHRAQELTKNMYAISYINARSKQAV